MFRALAAVPVVLAASLSIGLPQASAETAYRAHWTLDETDGATASDVSGNNNHGTSYNTVGDGSGYTFDGQSSRVIVPSSPSLNPGSADFSWGVTMSMTSPPSPLGETHDVLRKGLATTHGGFYKVEVKNVKGKAVARCASKSYRRDGTRVTAAVQGITSVADGRQHVITCARTSTGVTLYVDALTPRTKTYVGGLGSVSNSSALALGAKPETTAQTGFDWFDGRIYDAWVS